MNAARKAICADLRSRGMTGKQAYEATKQPEFLKQWVRVQESRKPIGTVEKTPVVNITWISKLLQQRLLLQLFQLEKQQEAARIREMKNKFIVKHIRKHGAREALRLWEEEFEKMKAAKAEKEKNEQPSTENNPGSEKLP